MKTKVLSTINRPRKSALRSQLPDYFWNKWHEEVRDGFIASLKLFCDSKTRMSKQVCARYPDGIDVTAASRKSKRKAATEEKKRPKKSSRDVKHGDNQHQTSDKVSIRGSPVASRRNSVVSNFSSTSEQVLGASNTQVPKHSRKGSITAGKDDIVNNNNYNRIDTAKHNAAVVTKPVLNRKNSSLSSMATSMTILPAVERKKQMEEMPAVDREMEERVKGIKGLLGLTPHQSIGDIVSKKYGNSLRQTTFS